MLMKPKKYSYSEGRNMRGGSQPQNSSRYKPRDDMNKRRSCTNCGSADHHAADCSTYKQGMKSLRYAQEEEDMNQTEEHEFYRGLIIKIGARCFFLQSRRQFQNGLSLVLGGGEESESLETQTSTGRSAKH